MTNHTEDIKNTPWPTGWDVSARAPRRGESRIVVISDPAGREVALQKTVDGTSSTDLAIDLLLEMLK